MSIDLASFDQAVPNTSDKFDYYQNDASCLTTAEQVTQESQARPRAVNHKPAEELVILPAPREGCCSRMLSGTPRHRTRSGRARYSADFRTVYMPDLMAGRGAPLVDVHCTGTAIRDFVKVTDESSFEEQMVVELFGRRRPTRRWSSRPRWWSAPLHLISRIEFPRSNSRIGAGRRGLSCLFFDDSKAASAECIRAMVSRIN